MTAQRPQTEPLLHTQGGAEAGSRLGVYHTECVPILLLSDCRIIFLTNNCKPAFGPPGIYR